MPELLRWYLFLVALTTGTVLPLPELMAQTPTSTTVVVDQEYEQYRKQGDDSFKTGDYLKARQQYQNCLEVPGFENNAYAEGQIEKSTNGLILNQQAEEARQQGNHQEALRIYRQMLGFNPSDARTRTHLTEHYEREGNRLYAQQQWAAAKDQYTEALQYTARQETLRLQIHNCEENIGKQVIPVSVIKPARHTGLKLFTGGSSRWGGGVRFRVAERLSGETGNTQSDQPDRRPRQHRHYRQSG